MVMLDHLGLDIHRPVRESVSILVGPNGSGKSSFLRDLAASHCGDRNVVIVCNTPHDRFAGLRGARRISVGKTTGSPRVIVKNAVAQSLAGSGAAFYRISSTLEYCGYRARFGFRMDAAALYGSTLDEIRQQQPGASGEVFDGVPENSSLLDEVDGPDLELALAFLRRHNPSEHVWIDASEKVLDFSRAREFASVLKLESRLRAWNVLRGIRVYLQRVDNGAAIEIQHASSGQLALISSLLFVIANIGVLISCGRCRSAPRGASCLGRRLHSKWIES